MALLIRHHAPGSTAASEQECGGVISLGRATDNTVRLPGSLVALHHARLVEQAGGVLHIECLTPLGVEVAGRGGLIQCDLRFGEEALIGGHRLSYGLRADGGSTLLEIHEADTAGLVATGALATDLAKSGLKMRRPALLLGFAVLVIGLLVPLLLPGHRLPAWARGVVANDGWLSPGPLSNGHRQFGADCGKCHVGVLRRVADEQCLSCHRDVAAHSDNPALAKVHRYAELRCGDCHQEHLGASGVRPQQTALCTGCHARPSQFPNFPELAEVSDFGRHHPSFRATVGVMRDGKPETERQRLSSLVADDDGLYFPHDVHLKTQGIRSDLGHETLQCDSCHHRDRAGPGFEPIRFERDCQRCHQLDIEFRGQPFRLPHGDPAAVRALLDAAPANSAARAVLSPPDGGTERRRPGAAAERGEPMSATDSVDEIFSRRVCGLCHETTSPDAGPVKIIKPNLRQSWLISAHFTHAPHQWLACKTCHAAEQSSSATDLLIPDLSTCRDCHAGIESTQGIASPCSSCHSFHRASRTPMHALPIREPDNERLPTDATAK